MTAFGEWLRRERVGSGLTQRELAERLGVASTYLSDLERGTRPPPCACRLLLLADALKVSPLAALGHAARSCCGAE